MKSNGTIWAWGNNEYGQLGDRTNDNKNTRVQIYLDTVIPPQPNPEPDSQIITNDDPSINYGIGWYSLDMPDSYTGAIMQGSRAGGAGMVILTFTGNKIQWRAMTSPTGGSAKVYIDNEYIGRFPLWSSETDFDVSVFNWSGDRGNHTIWIVPEATLPDFGINIDRFIVWW